MNKAMIEKSETKVERVIDANELIGRLWISTLTAMIAAAERTSQ